MVTHVVGWNFNPELTAQQREKAAARIKTALEALVGQVPGLLTMSVFTQKQPSSQRDLFLVSTHTDAAALAAYAPHPAHQAAAAIVREVTCDRVCLDGE